MYINFDYLRDSVMGLEDILTLQAIKQMKYEELENVVAMLLQDDRWDFYIKEGFVEQIKGTKKMSEIAKLRLTKKGVDFLDNLETAEIEDQDIKIFSWLEKIYKDQDKSIGNKKRTKTGIAQFRKHTGIELNCLAFLLNAFVSDEENFQYNNKLENAFFSSKNLYSRKFNIDECRVYNYYEKRKEYFDNKFKQIKDE